MAGFFEVLGNGINTVLTAIFGWAVAISPYFGLLLVTLVITVISTVVYKYTSDQSKLKEIKEEMNRLKQEAKECKGDMAKYQECNKKMTELSFETMKHSLFNFKYLLMTIVPLGIIFNWLKITFTGMNLWGSQWGWLWIYLIFSFVLSSILRKMLKVY